jgi:hypothetical protein
MPVVAMIRVDGSAPNHSPELRSSCQACDTFSEKGKVCLYVEQTDAKDQTALEAKLPVSPKHIVLRG